MMASAEGYNWTASMRMRVELCIDEDNGEYVILTGSTNAYRTGYNLHAKRLYISSCANDAYTAWDIYATHIICLQGTLFNDLDNEACYNFLIRALKVQESGTWDKFISDLKVREDAIRLEMLGSDMKNAEAN
jgi:hypothetical protein